MSDKPNYTPRYDDETINSMSNLPNISGFSPRQNVITEEAAQRQIAQDWNIAREILHEGDSKEVLEGMGFTILNPISNLFYKVTPPQGWTKTTVGLWTTVCDTDGNERIVQFFKGASYDTRAFMRLVNTESN